MQYLVDVRYGALKNIENFYTRVEGLKKDDVVIVRSNRGVECGEIVGEAKETDKEFKEGSSNGVLRKAGEDDQNKQKKIEEETIPEEYKYCKKKGARACGSNETDCDRTSFWREKNNNLLHS